MANYANLEAAIQAAIYENNTNDITGAALQTVLLQMVSDMGKSGMLCNGVCDGNTVPPVAPDSNIFYIAPTGTYANFGGLTVADGEWAIFIYNGGWQKQSIPVVTADAVPTTGSTNPVQSGGVADALDTKADIDGYYSTLTAGSAENLIGRGTVPAEYTRRTSGGSADIGSGAAAIEKIHGNTIVWNQLLANGNFASVATWGTVSCTYTVANNIATITLNTANTQFYQIVSNAVAGHKYYMGFWAKGSTAGKINLSAQVSTLSPKLVDINTTNWVRCSRIYTADGNGNMEVNLRNNTMPNGSQVFAKGFICVDLTLYGNDTLTTAEFEELYPLDWYVKNTGSLLSLTGTGIETNGFNQWDEEWEKGTYGATGAKENDGGAWVRCKNPIPVFPSTTYFGANLSATGYIYIQYLDAEKNFIAGVPAYDANNRQPVYNATFTTPANAYYIQFFLQASYGSTYKNDICINLSWSGYRNGEYEAYWDSTLALPITTVTSGGSAVFADGMKGAGTAYDELTGTKAVKRLGIVDLGSLYWTKGTYGGVSYFYTDMSSTLKPAASNNTAVNYIICSKYADIVKQSAIGGAGIDKVMAVSNTGRFTIQDSTYSGGDAAAFKTAMNGVYLVYELATPVEYTLDSEVNLNYRVDDFGTETLLPQNNATPTTAPIIYDVRYAMNAVDTLRNLPKNYISKDSMEHILTAMVTAGVISAYTLTWNATNENYDCTITA